MVDDADGGGTGGVSRYRFRQAVPVEPEHLLAARGRPGTVIASGRLAATHNRPASGLHCRCSSREWQGGVRGRIVRAYVGRVHRAVPGRVDSSADGFAHSADCCPSLAVLLLSAACYLIPHIIVPARSWAHPFRGLGGQFLMSIPSMFQASDCGTLMLLGGGIAVWAITLRLRRLLWLMAAGLAVASCALHPTYLAPLAVALLGFAVADLASQRTIRRFGWYTGTGLAAVIVVVATNPVVRDSLTHDAGDPQRYLAFERIPHHTLISHWSVQDAFLAVVVLVGAGLTVRLTRAWWVGIVLMVCLIMTVGTALTVEITRNVTLAMMFPWRITVFLVPVATLTVIVWFLRPIAERVEHIKILFIVAACLMPVCFGRWH